MNAKRSPLTFGLALALAACGTTEPEPEPPIGIDGIPVDHTESAPLIEAHFRAWSEKSAAAYEALLEEPGAGRGAAGFRFYILAADADQFPWLQQSFWDYDVEMDIVRNMTNPTFSGEEQPVDSIDGEYTVLNAEDVEEGRRVTTVDAVIQILVGPDTGWIADTRLKVETIRQGDGFLRIRSISEVERLAPGRDASVEESTLGQIKGLYR